MKCFLYTHGHFADTHEMSWDDGSSVCYTAWLPHAPNDLSGKYTPPMDFRYHYDSLYTQQYGWDDRAGKMWGHICEKSGKSYEFRANSSLDVMPN